MTGLYADQTLIHRNAIYIREHIPQLKPSQNCCGIRVTRPHGSGRSIITTCPSKWAPAVTTNPLSWNQKIYPRGRDKDDEYQIFSLKKGSFGATLSWLAADGTDKQQTDVIAASEAIKRLSNYAKSEKRCLVVGLFPPHTRFVFPRKYFDMCPLDALEVPTVPKSYLETLLAPARKSLTRKKDQVNLDPELGSRQFRHTTNQSVLPMLNWVVFSILSTRRSCRTIQS